MITTKTLVKYRWSNHYRVQPEGVYDLMVCGRFVNSVLRLHKDKISLSVSNVRPHTTGWKKIELDWNNFVFVSGKDTHIVVLSDVIRYLQTCCGMSGSTFWLRSNKI